MSGFTAVERGPEADALLALLNGGDLLTGDGERPDGGGFPGGDTSGQFVPYVVLYPGVVSRIDGPMSDPYADTSSEYQITAVGQTRAQAQWAADKARGLILAVQKDLPVPGRDVQLIGWGPSQEVRRDDDATPPLFFAVDVYSIDSTPA